MMFDHDGVKTMKIFELSFCMSNLKSWLPKKYEVEGPNKYNLHQYMDFQNLLYNFFKWISSVIFFQDLVYLRLISKSPQHYRKSGLQWVSLHKILNRKIKSFIFKIKFLMLKLDFENNISKIKNKKNSNLVRINLTSKFLRHHILVPWPFRG